MFDTKLLKQASEATKIPLCVLRAVVEVESNGEGFLSDGRPSILFEGHCFWKELAKRGIDPEPLKKLYPSIIYPKWNKKAYLGGLGEWKRLEQAMSIHKEAAQASTSWGAFQILGANYRECGCHSVEEFVDDMHQSEQTQLATFCMFLCVTKLDEDLRRLDWKSFAVKYNGPGYAKNRYDVRLKQHYEQCIKGDGVCLV